MEITSRPVVVIPILDPSSEGQARRAVAELSAELQLDATRAGAASVVSTELATNLSKHSSGGKLLIQQLGSNGQSGMQLLAIDNGPGIPDMAAALSDGWSTSGTLGGGLGAARRMSDDFDIFSSAAGTVVVSEFWKDGKDPSLQDRIWVGAVSLPVPGEVVNGDGWTVKNVGDVMILMVVDGLGHGPAASDAAREAERIMMLDRSDSPAVLLQDCHEALMKTRGAAMGIAALSLNPGLAKFAGTGNIAGTISTAETSRGLASHNGTLGHVMPHTQEFSYPWTTDSLLVMHSDGVSARWNLNSYPGLRRKHPALIAAVLHRDFGRSRDDATVLVARNKAA
jgi:anti-sigma regulatory factor (Ser/Thr protein kinase)